MNLLGLYLLISMLFVFGAMVEFTVVLIAKQIAESQVKCPKSISQESEMKNILKKNMPDKSTYCQV